MFTGIVQNLGTILSLKKNPHSLSLCISSSLPARCFKKGASIAVDGICLTVEKYEASKKRFWVTAIEETLARTTLGAKKAKDLVHLEPPLTLRDFLGGHLVSGHVDGLAQVLQPAPSLILQLPTELLRFCATKGSICVQGVSLTIAEQKKDTVRLELIPETLKSTTLGALKKGDKVSVEVDLIARTLEHLYASR